MILFRIALRNLLRRSRKNLAIGALIAVSVAVFFTGNAILESSVSGIQRTFSEQFTADLSVSAKAEQSFSLFGSDTPVIGDYEVQPLLINASETGARLARVPGVEATAYVLSSPLLVESGGARGGGLGLGVIGDEYFALFSQLRFVSGSAPKPGSSGWVVITEERAKDIEKAQGRAPAPGDRILLSVFRNQSFAIREASLAGVIRYEPSAEALAQVILVDARIIRSLNGFAQTDAQSAAPPGSAAPAAPAAPAASQDIDSLFSETASPPTAPTVAKGEAGAGTEVPPAPVSVDELRRTFREARTAGEATAKAASTLNHEGSWHFILIKAAAASDRKRVAAAIRSELSLAGLPALVRDWRGTAGSVAAYVYVMRFVFDIGIAMVALIVLMLTMNSIVVSVFERTAEIGTMRALGAKRSFVRKLFVIETISLSLAAGIVGVVLGLGAVGLIRIAPLHFGNDILILLFGGSTLRPLVTAGNFALSLASVLGLGTIAWVIPVRLALRIQPIRAIMKG